MKPQRSLESTDDAAAAMRLSAMMDGELEPDDVDGVCGQWRGDDATRARWHTYHLIGDALRSDELCGHGHDERFLAALHERLAAEPVRLGPSATESSRRRSARMQRWSRSTWASAGMAAGVALVAGAVWVNRPSAPGPVATLASSGTTSGSVSPGVRAPGLAAAPRAAANAVQFERYVAAHRQFQSAAALSPASGYVRDAVYESGAR